MLMGHIFKLLYAQYIFQNICVIILPKSDLCENYEKTHTLVGKMLINIPFSFSDRGVKANISL